MRVSPWIVLAGLFPAVASAARGDDTAAVGSSSDATFWERGHVDLGYTFRAANGHGIQPHEQDQRTTETLFFEAGWGQHFRMEFSGMATEDIDGRPLVSRFRDIYDTYGSQWALGYVYTAYVEGLELGPVQRLRLGRQYLADGVDVRFDGGLLETAPLADMVRFIAYGGVPVHFFESSVGGDWIAGGAVEVVAIPRTSIRFDYTHVTDYWNSLARQNLALGLPADDLREDNRYQVTVAVRPIEELKLMGRATTFGGHSTRAEAEVFFLQADAGFTGRIHYAAQIGAYEDLSLQWTPLDQQLGPVAPYQEVTLDLTQTVGEHVILGAGGSYRGLFKRSDEGPFNHEFGRAYGQVTVMSWPWDGLSLDVAADYYRGISMGRTFEIVGSLGQDLPGGVKLGIGSSWSAFAFDQFFLTEEENVRTYFANAEWRPTSFFRLKASYSYQTDSQDRYHVVECHARIDF
ncbi:MAG TPA: hypothetical protein VFF73_12380 [Planctomycetota bacterium]|nr:hypothetical protein [Planctomycetota bacterium]